MTYLYIFLALIAVLTAWFAYDRERFWERFFGSPDLGAVQFATLAPGSRPNEALACPEGHCPNYEHAIEAPAFNVDAATLAGHLAGKLETIERVTRVDDGNDPLRKRYVVRTKLMRYPDTVNIEAIDLEPVNGKARSSLAIHSRSQIGYGDQGVNKARVLQWLSLLEGIGSD